MAGIAFPSWAYKATQAAQIVASQAAFTALGAGWALTPFIPAGQLAPIDTTPLLTATDIRLQQMLVELRELNLMINMGLNIPDELSALRAEVLALDTGLAT